MTNRYLHKNYVLNLETQVLIYQ